MGGRACKCLQEDEEEEARKLEKLKRQSRHPGKKHHHAEQELSASPFSLALLHQTSPESWGRRSKAIQQFGQDCQNGAITSAADAAKALKEVRAEKHGTLGAFAQAVKMAQSHGVGASEEELCQGALAFAASLAVQLPLLFKETVPLLLQHSEAPQTTQVLLSRRQCGALIAAGIFNALPVKKGPQISKRPLQMSSFDWQFVLDSERTKCLCILSYFLQLARAGDGFLDEQVSFGRRSEVEKCHDFWMKLDIPLCAVSIESGSIEDMHDALQADFANEYLGGKVLRDGYFQEEMRFISCPECLVGMLLAERALPNEALYIVGAQQFSKYSGHGKSFKFEGLRDVLEERVGAPDAKRRWGPHIVAFDALVAAGDKQFSPGNVRRELTKCYVACLGDKDDFTAGSFATGNWGCGAFGGDPELKSMIQWLAATAAGRGKLLYFTFNDPRVKDLPQVIESVKAKCMTCADLYRLLLNNQPGTVFRTLL